MPRKRSSAKIKSIARNLPHELYCERCDISVTCPRVEQILDVAGGKSDGESDKEVVLEEEIKEKDEQDNLGGLSKEEVKNDDNTATSSASLEKQEQHKNKDIWQLNMEEKCDLVKNILLSEAVSIYHDQKEATLEPDCTISQIAAKDMTSWIASRHPLLLAISDGLSKVMDTLNLTIKIKHVG